MPYRLHIAHFLKKEDGGSSVEFALWLPLLVSVMVLVADTSFAFMRQSNLLDVSRETARIVARHGLTVEEAVLYAEGRMQSRADAPRVSVEIDSDATNVTVRIAVAMHDLAPFGILENLYRGEVSVSTVHALEPI